MSLRSLRTRDADLSALRRATRTAIVMPTLFAVETQVIGNPMTARRAAARTELITATERVAGWYVSVA